MAQGSKSDYTVGSRFMINSRFWLLAGNGLTFLVEILDMNINNKSATSIIFFLTTFTLLTAAES